ncbi:hypothetical protein FXB39_18875 [Nocardioides sp. BGMRC 2183]|nr:hypothetical protein FXB39_18875 [Nocardioides sp. BGMRC 2183]
MSDSSIDSDGPEETSDRLYTPDELEEFARRQLSAARSGQEPDPLTDPIAPPAATGWSRAAGCPPRRGSTSW